MQTAQYYYQGEPVEIQGTNRTTAYIELDGVLVPVAFNTLRESHANQASRVRDREVDTNEGQEAQEETQHKENQEE